MMIAVQRREIMSQMRSTPATALRKSLTRKKHSLKQMNTKIVETATPKYLRAKNALEMSLTASAYSPISRMMEITLNTAKGIHLSSNFRG